MSQSDQENTWYLSGNTHRASKPAISAKMDTIIGEYSEARHNLELLESCICRGLVLFNPNIIIDTRAKYHAALTNYAAFFGFLPVGA